MKALYERDQSRIQLSGGIGRTTFKLKVKVELDDEEKSLSMRYNLYDAIVIKGNQPSLVRNSLVLGLAVAFLGLFFWFAIATANFDRYSPISPFQFAFVASPASGLLAAFIYYHLRRKTIYLRDLISGRTFRCRTVIDLVEKEAWMDRVLSYIRQVLEASKHWDGVETRDVEALPPEEAKQAILPKMHLFAVDFS